MATVGLSRIYRLRYRMGVFLTAIRNGLAGSF